MHVLKPFEVQRMSAALRYWHSGLQTQRMKFGCWLKVLALNVLDLERHQTLLNHEPRRCHAVQTQTGRSNICKVHLLPLYVQG